MKKYNDRFEKYKKISFPLNVYAFITYFSTGEFRELNYGLFKNENDNLIQAQKNSTDLLFQHLFKSPAKILEVGIGLGKTHQKLMDKGFDCVGITPDQMQIDIVQERIPEANLVCTMLENFELENKFDIVLFQESAQYIKTPELLKKTYTLLKENGRILIVDGFLIGEKSLHDINEFIALAKHYGFELIKSINLSDNAASKEDYILNNLNKYKDKVCKTLNVDLSVIEDLVEAIDLHKEGYRTKTRGYFFLEFIKVKTETIDYQKTLGEKSIENTPSNIDYSNFEPNETKLIQDIIDKGDVILDIGANIGYYTLQFSKLTGRNGLVYAFEPEPKNFNLLKKHIELDKCSNVILINKGVSNKESTIRLYLSDINIGMHRAYKSLVCSNQYIEMDTIILDNYFIDTEEKIDFIKIDIEGYEYFAFQGMKAILKRNNQIKIMMEFSPISIIESGETPYDLIRFLNSLHFEFYDIDNNLKKINTENFMEELEVLNNVKIEEFGLSKKITSKEIASVEKNIQKKLQELGYSRPVLENLYLKKFLRINGS